MAIFFLSKARSAAPAAAGRKRQEAFTSLVKPHMAALYRLAFRFTGRQSDAEDLLQELLTRLYASPKNLEDVETLRPWLARALYNLFIDERRRFARSPLGHLQSPLEGGSDEDHFPTRANPSAAPEACAEMTLIGSQLEMLVARLPDEQREVVILHDVEGFELQEAAGILGIALGTVKSRLFRAHERLREWLRERNLSPSDVVSGEDSAGIMAVPISQDPTDEL